MLLQGGIGNLLFQLSAATHIRALTGVDIRFVEELGGEATRLESYIKESIPLALPHDCFRFGLTNPRACQNDDRKIRELLVRAKSIVRASRTVSDSSNARRFRRSVFFQGYFQDASWHSISSIERVVELLCGNREGFEVLEGVIGVHLRRSDYLRGLNNLDVGYFMDRVKIIDPDRKRSVLVTGDDDLANLGLQSLLVADGWKVLIPDSLFPGVARSAWRDFHTLASCPDLICSNSTFAWWAAKVADRVHQGNKVYFPITNTIRWVDQNWETSNEVTGNGQISSRYRIFGIRSNLVREN